MHSFVKDHVLYNKFMNISNNAKKPNIYNLHMTNLLHLGLQEVMTWNQVKMGKFMGRVLFIYLDITPSELKKYGYSTIRIIAPELLPMCFPVLPYINHPNFPQGGDDELFPHPLP